MEENKLFCPFTRMPCLGRLCACAAYSRDKDFNRMWWCGMLPSTDYNVWQQQIDYQTAEELRDEYQA